MCFALSSFPNKKFISQNVNSSIKRVIPQKWSNGICQRSHSTLVLGSWPTTPSKWNRAVLDAEKIVGYPSSYFSIRCLLSDEISNIALQLRKLLGTNHPLLKTAKRLVYNGRNTMQTRGLVVLLVSKGAGHPIGSLDYLEANRLSGISQRQRSLAEITEMIHTAHLIHKGILNLSASLVPDTRTLDDLQFGNKISILGGDYLLANACILLAELRNSKVVDLISSSIADFMQSQFYGDHDRHGNSIPGENATVEEWEQQNFLMSGSLLSRSCQSTLELAGYDIQLQDHGFELGKCMGLAMQVQADLQPFVNLSQYPPGTAFSLTSSPVILHLQNDPSLLDYIRANGHVSVENLDFKKIHAIISQSDAVEKTKALLLSYTSKAEECLKSFKSSDAIKVLASMIHALKE